MVFCTKTQHPKPTLLHYLRLWKGSQTKWQNSCIDFCPKKSYFTKFRAKREILKNLRWRSVTKIKLTKICFKFDHKKSLKDARAKPLITSVQHRSGVRDQLRLELRPSTESMFEKPRVAKKQRRRRPQLKRPRGLKKAREDAAARIHGQHWMSVQHYVKAWAVVATLLPRRSSSSRERESRVRRVLTLNSSASQGGLDWE